MASPDKTKKIDWPQPVRRYVQRAFQPEHNIPGIERVEMERKLKETITKANENNTLGAIDWDTFALPQQLIQKERKMLGHMHNSPWNPQLAFNALYESNGKDIPPKKRKQAEYQENSKASDANQPPWRKSAKRTAFVDRIQQPQAGVDASNGIANGIESKLSISALEKRQRRFENGQNKTTSPRPWATSTVTRTPSPATPQGPVVGRCQDLEKKYFRLTSAPNPDTVRPLEVLRKTLDLLKKKWRQDNNYSYICDQFKSLRQDLTVQHIKNDFTISAYEIHARIALERGDLGEYNQCQTQLKALYSQSAGGHPMEFLAYRILYFIHTCNRTDMNDVLADLTSTEKRHPAVKHALDVRSSLALGNYHRFFRLYLDTPNMGAYLMDMFVVRERLVALSNICKAYRPDIKLRFITEELGFESDSESVQFLIEQHAQHLLEEREVDLHLLTSKAGLLFETAKSAAYAKVDIKGQI